MITESFTVKTTAQMVELQNFIRNNMSTARFVGNPYHSQTNVIYIICLTYEVEDIGKIHPLYNNWRELEKQLEPKEVKVSLLNRIINYLKKRIEL